MKYFIDKSGEVSSIIIAANFVDAVLVARASHSKQTKLHVIPYKEQYDPYFKLSII